MEEQSEATHQHGGQSNWRQFWLLLWKNWLLQKKKVIRTILLVLFPILSSLLLALGRHNFSPIITSSATIYDSFFVSPHLNGDLTFPPPNLILAYFPNTTLVTRIMNRTATIMGVKNPTNMGFASENDVEDYVSIHQNIYGAIVFPDWEDLTSLPKNIIYKIRLRSDQMNWKTKTMFSYIYTIMPRDVKDQFGGDQPVIFICRSTKY